MPAPLALIEAGAGLLLLIGLWTPAAGAVVAGIGLWKVFTHTGDIWASVLSGALGVALALVGPGAWSIDRLLFGRKRIDIKDR